MDERRAIKTALITVWLAAATASACSSSSAGDDDPESPAKQSAANENANPDSGAARDGGDTSTTCGWDARLDRGDDAPRGACHAKRHLLSCPAGGGATEMCLSDGSQCTPDAGETACEEHCKPNEYAIACGAVGGDPGNPDPPGGCHDMSATPGGTFFMCCPCE
jgi:hypothetical protein